MYRSNRTFISEINLLHSGFADDKLLLYTEEIYMKEAVPLAHEDACFDTSKQQTQNALGSAQRYSVNFCKNHC